MINLITYWSKKSGIVDEKIGDVIENYVFDDNDVLFILAKVMEALAEKNDLSIEFDQDIV